MPLGYLAVGLRLGLPVHLVHVGQHYFVRWEEPGFRVNIETTIVDRASVTPDDTVYLETEGLARADIRGSTLRNLTRREAVGMFFFERACHWDTHGRSRQTEYCMDLARARHLAPDDPSIHAVKDAVFAHYGIRPEHRHITITPKERKK